MIARVATVTSRPPGLRRTLNSARAFARTPPAAAAMRVFAVSRTAVFLIAFYAALPLYQRGTGVPRLIVPDASLDRLVAPFGRLNLVFAPLAKWDALWYLKIAHDGYSYPRTRGFFPLYPMVVKAVAGFSSSPRALLVASYVVALAAFAGALYFLYRLVDLELGAAAARNTLWLIAFFPAAFVFGAPYPESLFLLLSVGAFYAARTDRWAVAGLLALLASATRAAGVLLLIPLALIYLYGPRRRTDPQAPRKRRHQRYPIRRDALWLGLAPLGFVAFTAYLGIAHGDVALAGHHVRLTEGGFFHIVDRAFSAVPSLLGQPHGTDLRPAQAIGSFGFLLLAIAATVGALRRLPAAYGVYSAAVLVLALSRGAVVALPRYLAVVFPLYMWGALASGERGITSAVLAVSATLLGVFTYQFATWNFVG
ncbi:MAG: hypothetical protein E6G00_00665 [Actinobacteria bacterium]|nr:MAG: hypothetical protein E6G00_00665 [Actinomycetota bacterium]